MGKGDNLIDGKRLLLVMKLAIQQGEEMTLKFEGPDEADAAAAVEKFLKENM